MVQQTTCPACGARVPPDARCEVPEPVIPRRRPYKAALYVGTMVTVAAITAAIVYFIPL